MTARQVTSSVSISPLTHPALRPPFSKGFPWHSRNWVATLRTSHVKSIALLTLSVLVFSFRAHADEQGFTPLFNGKDLTGWHPVNVAADTFSVRDGMLITTGKPIGVMATERMYENFIIELDWQHMEYGGNSGLYIWGEPMPAPGVPFSKGIEVQILDLGYEAQHPDGANKWFTSQGDIFPIWGAKMTPTGRIAGQRSFPTENRTKPSPEWNHYHVVCDKGEIRLSINGKEVTVGKDCVPRKGFICLESEGAECHFKNIRIKELPSSNTPPEQTAEAYAGFHQLFDGKGLGGWKMSEELKPFWSADGAHFTAKADPAGLHKDLVTEKEFGDFELIADWRPLGKASATSNCGIQLRGDKRAIVPTANPANQLTAKTSADKKSSKWNRFHITLKGEHLTVKLNDQTIMDNTLVGGIVTKGPIVLLNGGDGMEFANLFIKEL